MSACRLLIDTNVFIALEDDRKIAPDYSSLLQLAAKHKVDTFIHEAAHDDISRDKSSQRRNISLSKLKKFQIIPKVRGLTEENLAQEFGLLRKPNDVVDATLLHALSEGIVDFLVTEDRGLHTRALRYASWMSDRVLFVSEAVQLIRQTYEPTEVPIKYVEEVDACALSLSDPIFESLREDYQEFDSWWREKCVRKSRKCWVVEDSGIAGIVVRKDEEKGNTDATNEARKILKICTFKVRPESRGSKLGELLLKQVFWFAQSNSYDLIYITTYPGQETLIYLLEYFGFENTDKKNDGELVYEKKLNHDRILFAKGKSLFDLARKNYPKFYVGDNVKGYGIPIKEAYHDELFPELKIPSPQLELFNLSTIKNRPRKPGNTIRKVYLCRAKANILEPGTLLFFYKGASDSPPSQAITTVGIFENMCSASSTETLIRYTSGRSVYSEVELKKWEASEKRPVKVINFLLMGYLSEPIDLAQLKNYDVVHNHPPQSIFQIQSKSLSRILSNLNIGFEV
jgi:predicted nucleic acid-binding protein/GNAT superfamily N-acetyltransferase